MLVSVFYYSNTHSRSLGLSLPICTTRGVDWKGSELPSCSEVLTESLPSNSANRGRPPLPSPCHPGTQQALPSDHLLGLTVQVHLHQNAELCDWVFTIVTIQISTSCFLFNNLLKAQRCAWQLPCICWRTSHAPVYPNPPSSSQPLQTRARTRESVGGMGKRRISSWKSTIAAKFYFSSHQSKPLSWVK